MEMEKILQILERFIKEYKSGKEGPQSSEGLSK